MNRGDVVIVDYPYSDASGSKVRPALIVQADDKNKSLNDTIIALITSRLHRSLDTHVVVDISTPDGLLLGLRLKSAVQCENLFTIDQRFILGVIGSLPGPTLTAVDDCLRKALGL
jgi:mRNA interferase MazF